jgi:predicted MFS family arabinose efflux permease
VSIRDVASWRPSRWDFRAPSATRGVVAYTTALLTVLNIVNYADRMIIAVLVQPIKIDLRLSDTQMGLLSGFAFVAVYAAAGLPLARLADRIGRRWVLAMSIAFWSLMTGVCGLTHSFGQLVVARLGVGLGEAGCVPSGTALLADLYPTGRRTLPMAIFIMGSPIGIAIGLSVGGKIAALFGWRAAFLLVGLPGLALALLILFTLTEPRRLDAREDVLHVSLRSTIVKLFRNRTYRLTVGAQIFYLFCTLGTLSWLPAFYMRSHALSVAQVGLFFGIAYGLGAAVGCYVGGYILQKATQEAGGLHWAACMVVLALPCFVTALLTPSATVSLLAIMLYGALMGAAGAPIIAGQQSVVDTGCRATASAVGIFLSSYVGGGLGSLLVGMASDALTPVFGHTALRTALLIASTGTIFVGMFALGASRSLAADAKSSGR